MAIGLAFKAFFQVLFRKDAAARVAAALSQSAAEQASDKPAALPKPATPPSEPARPKLPTRSDALTLLSTLQREARFLDLVGEPLDQFSDAQVGSAARQVIADVRKTLQRMFNIQPIEGRDEGSTLEITRPISPTRLHVIGREAEQATHGTLVHRGWMAQQCQTPTWNGSEKDAMVLSPVEIDVDG